MTNETNQPVRPEPVEGRVKPDSKSGLDPASAVSIGRVAAPHGVHGELRVEPLTDFPDRFDKGRHVWLLGEPHVVERARWQKNAVLLKLEGIDTRTDAQRVQGKELMLPEAGELPDEGIFYQHDIIGLRVEDAKGEALGTVADILSTGANDVYVVRGERGELLVPAVEDVVREIDVAGGRIVIDLLPGLEFRKSTWGRKPAPGQKRRPAVKGPHGGSTSA
jgi:16S rRNA processing protein RimM